MGEGYLKKVLFGLIALISAVAQAGTITGTLQTPSGLPVKNGTLTFQLQQVGLINGTGAIAATTSQCYTSNDGTVVGLPNPLAMPIVATQTSGAGSLPAGIYYMEITLANNSGETVVSPELQIQLSSTGSLIVSLPTTFPTAATQVNVYIGTARGAETLQGSFNQTFPATYGQSVPLSAGTAPPGSNSVPCVIAFNDTIIPYMGYNVSLTSSTGNAYPGWPQAWQLNGGPNGTINVSSGAPLWNGTVVYPMPILSQPLNHGPQSISGPLDMDGYNLTDIGIFTAAQSNTIMNPAQCGSQAPPSWCVGSDIGAWTNSALQSCASQCTVYIPAGSYSFSTGIVLPLLISSNYTIVADQGAVLTFTGTGDMIQAPVSNSPNVSNWRIHGGHWIGNSGATSGLHILPTNSASVTGMFITGFSNGPGIWVEGANGVTIFDNTIQGNLDGVRISPTYCNMAVCGTGVTGSPFSPNQIAVLSNRLTNNTGHGFYSSDPVTAQLSGAQNVVVAFNDLEINGTAVQVGRSHGLVVSGNYFEGSVAQIVLGIAGGADGNQFRFYASQGCQVTNNFFTDVEATPYDINLLDTADCQISGNTSNQVTLNSTNCNINTLANTGTNIGETGTVVGKNHWEHYSSMGNVLCIAGSPVTAFVGAGSYTQLNQNYFPLLVNLGFAFLSSGASETVAVSGNVTAASQCFVTPYNHAADTIAASTTFHPSGANTGTLYHPTGAAGTLVNIFCTGVPN